MMRVDMALGPPEEPAEDLVVVDIFRSSTSIVTALENGAKEIIPCHSLGRARILRRRLGEEALLVGEAIERLRFAPPPCAMSEADLTFGLGFALDAAGALRTALANVANLMLVHGRLASRPPLRLEPPEPRAKLAPNGKPGAWRREVWAEPTFGDHTQAQREVEVAVSALKRRNHYPDGAFGVVEWEPRPQELVDERAEYAAWRAGLEWLAAGLAGALETRTVLPPRAAWRPWAGDVEAEPLRDLFAPGALGVHDATEAAQFEASRATGRRRPIAGGSVYGFAPGKPGRGGREA